MGRSRMPAELTLTIESLDGDGYGVSRYRKQEDAFERTIRLKNALPGETVTARMLKRRKGEWFGEAVQIDKAAHERADAACEFYPRCGGCAVQHLDYAAQLALKQNALTQALADNGIVAQSLRQPVHGPRFGYRTKARLGVRVVKEEVLVGFRESFSNRVGRMSYCLTLSDSLSVLLAPLKALIQSLSIPRWIPQVEVAAGDNEAALILRHLEPLSKADFDSIRTFGIDHGVRVFTQSGGYETLTSASDTSSGAAESDCLGYQNSDYGLHFLFEPADFTQVNLDMNRKLVRAAIAGLAAPAGAKVLDLFCGIGNFSLPLAATGLSVLRSGGSRARHHTGSNERPPQRAGSAV